MCASGAPVVDLAPHRELMGMAWIEQRTRSDGGRSAVVRWRLGGSRTGRVQTETFGAGSDDLARAAGYNRMVEAAGQEWPDCWVKGEGFVRPRSTDDPMRPQPTVAELAEEYVRQIVDLPRPASAMPVLSLAACA